MRLFMVTIAQLLLHIYISLQTKIESRHFYANKFQNRFFNFLQFYPDPVEIKNFTPFVCLSSFISFRAVLCLLISIHKARSCHLQPRAKRPRVFFTKRYIYTSVCCLRNAHVFLIHPLHNTRLTHYGISSHMHLFFASTWRSRRAFYYLPVEFLVRTTASVPQSAPV